MKKKTKWKVLAFYDYCGTVRCIQSRIKNNGKAVFKVNNVAGFFDYCTIYPRLDVTKQWEGILKEASE